jgi:hypothetical protein
MPTETTAFYRWVFLEALPLLLGAVNLGRIVLILSDGDSQEFNAINEGIYKFFKNAQRGQCAYHIVQKTWEAKLPNNDSFANPNKADPLTIAVRRWIHTWMNGASCGSVDQYDFQRNLYCLFWKQMQNFIPFLAQKVVQRYGTG